MELAKIGYQGSCLADSRWNPLSAHFELHIEQGPRLEERGKKIGVVNGIQGNCRLRVRVCGEKSHAGSTAMLARTDALVATARIVLHVEHVAIEHEGFATVGTLENKDSSTNCIPGEVIFTVDLRNPRASALESMEQSIRAKMDSLTVKNPKLRFEVDKIWESPSARFNTHIVDCVRRSAVGLFGHSAVAELESFAGHDSAMTNLQVPTAMIFVPSRDGISHAPEEYTSKEQWYLSTHF